MQYVLEIILQEVFFGKEFLDILGGEKRLKYGGKISLIFFEDEDRVI